MLISCRIVKRIWSYIHANLGIEILNTITIIINIIILYYYYLDHSSISATRLTYIM